MQISNLMINDGASVYYDIKFRNIIEDHLTFLKNSNEITEISIEPSMAYKYEGDLFGLLFHYKLTFEYHWITMRLNNMTNPNQLRNTVTSLLIPNRTILERLKNVYMTKDRIIN